MGVYEVEYNVGNALANDASGVALRELVTELKEGGSKIRKAMDAGLSPEDFKKAEALNQSFEKAVEAVEKIWQSLHGK